ncbi:MAG TPA: tetratricopeptide repeat protein [Anaerolineae bacterium]|nr:tetratricopeptide repeat protein [Anaerolineae bacterium]
MELIRDFLKGELIQSRFIDFKWVVVLGIGSVVVIIPVVARAFQFVSLIEVSSDSDIRFGLIYAAVVVIAASLRVLYARDRAYYSVLQRSLARACVVGAIALGGPLLWSATVSGFPSIGNWYHVADRLLWMVRGAGVVWLVVELARDASTSSDYVFLVCEIGEGPSRSSPRAEYTTQAVLNELRSALYQEEPRIRIERLDEVVVDEERARQLGRNARATVVVYGYFRKDPGKRPTAKLHTRFEVLNVPRFYPGTLGLKQGALVDVEGFALETELTNGTVCLSCFLIGLFYYWERRYQEALDSFVKAQTVLQTEVTELGPQEILLYRGNALYHLGRYQDAAETYTEAIGLDRSFARAYNNRGASYGELGRTLVARGDAEDARELLSQAIDSFSRAIAEDPDLTVAYLDRGRVWSQVESHDEAVEDYAVVIARTPKDPGPYLYRAEAHAALGAYDDAISDLSTAIRLAPNNMLGRLNRAGCHHHLQQYSQAIRDYRRVTQLVPRSRDAAFAHRKLGDIYSTIGDPGRAVDCYTRALRLDPDNAVVYVNRGNKKLALSRFEDAAGDFREAIALDPDLAAANSGLGSAQVYLGHLKEAVDSFRRALERDPGCRSAELNMEETLRLISDQERRHQVAE